MREVARLGFVLLGIHVAFSALQSSAYLLRFFDPEHESVALGSVSLGVLVLLVFIPGCILTARSRAFAIYLFPNQESPPSQPDFVAAGLAVLGAYLFIAGLSSALSYGATSVIATQVPTVAWAGARSALLGVLEATLGMVLFRYPGTVLERLGRFDRERAA